MEKRKNGRGNGGCRCGFITALRRYQGGKYDYHIRFSEGEGGGMEKWEWPFSLNPLSMEGKGNKERSFSNWKKEGRREATQEC